MNFASNDMGPFSWDTSNGCHCYVVHYTRSPRIQSSLIPSITYLVIISTHITHYITACKVDICVWNWLWSPTRGTSVHTLPLNTLSQTAFSAGLTSHSWWTPDQEFNQTQLFEKTASTPRTHTGPRRCGKGQLFSVRDFVAHEMHLFMEALPNSGESHLRLALSTRTPHVSSWTSFGRTWNSIFVDTACFRATTIHVAQYGTKNNQQGIYVCNGPNRTFSIDVGHLNQAFFKFRNR